MFYVDTSVVVSAVTIEPSNRTAAGWLAAQPPGSLWISEWVDTEVASALAMKVRLQTLSVEERQSSWQQWLELRLAALGTVPIEDRHFRLAANLLTRSPVPLRAGDALHLAMAVDRGLGLATRDRAFAAAVAAAGMTVADLTVAS